MTSPDLQQSASARVLERLKTEFTFQISVDTDGLPLGLLVADIQQHVAAFIAGVSKA